MAQKTTNPEYLNKSLKFDEAKATQFVYFDIDQFASKDRGIKSTDERRLPWDKVFNARVIETNEHFYKCIVRIPWRSLVVWVPAFLVSGVDD